MSGLKGFILYIITILTVLSCESKQDKIAERNLLIDSTVTVFQKKYFKNELDSLFEKTHFNGAISIKKGDEVLYEKYNGFQDFKTKEKLNPESVFAIASLSKQFTAAAILLLQEQGKLKVTDKASQYLTEFQKPELENITIHQLLNHTSRLNDFGENLHSKTGTAFNYSNKGYRFLGEIIEKASGETLGKNFEKLFTKAGLQHTSTADLFAGNDFAGANLGNGNIQEAVAEMPKRLAEDDISVAAGGILSTINDLHLWNQNLYLGKILNHESLQKMTTKSSHREEYILGKVGYGYGIMIGQNAPKVFFHTGYVKGSPSLLMYYPETKTSVVILSNIADETKGKEEIFIPHKTVKNSTDKIENAVEELQKEMIKPLPN